MTKIKLGGIVANMSGKIGGQVYSHNRAGLYLRNIGTIGVAPTALQIASKARFASVSTAWTALTEDQRLAWSASAVNYNWVNVFADTYSPTGYSLFCSVNNNLLMAGVPMISWPVFPIQPPPIVGLSLNQLGGAGNLNIASPLANPPADTAWLIDVTMGISPSKNNYKVLLSQLLVLVNADALPYSIFADYTAKYGVIVPGTKLGLRARPLNLLSGTPGQYIFTSIILI